MQYSYNIHNYPLLFSMFLSVSYRCFRPYGGESGVGRSLVLCGKTIVDGGDLMLRILMSAVGSLMNGYWMSKDDEILLNEIVDDGSGCLICGIFVDRNCWMLSGFVVGGK